MDFIGTLVFGKMEFRQKEFRHMNWGCGCGADAHSTYTRARAHTHTLTIVEIRQRCPNSIEPCLPVREECNHSVISFLSLFFHLVIQSNKKFLSVRMCVFLYFQNKNSFLKKTFNDIMSTNFVFSQTKKRTLQRVKISLHLSSCAFSSMDIISVRHEQCVVMFSMDCLWPEVGDWPQRMVQTS